MSEREDLAEVLRRRALTRDEARPAELDLMAEIRADDVCLRPPELAAG